MQPRDLVAALCAGVTLSGTALATRFGVTRAAVWKRIEELRAAGLPIDVVPGRGYRLGAVVDLLDADAIRAALASSLCSRLNDIAIHWEIDSTSSELMRNAVRLPDLSVCLAERQSAGRGRRGRAWQSPPACNVYLSLLKRFEHGMGELAGLSLAAGVAVAQALQQCGARGIGLKWPNDVLAGGAKLAGILVELGGEFLGPCHAVIGIGINLRLPAVARNAIDQPATDMTSVVDRMPTRNQVIASVLGSLIGKLDAFELGGFGALQAEFLALDALRDCALTLSEAHGTQLGIGAGVDARGALLLRQGDTIASFDSAEVTVRRA